LTLKPNAGTIRDRAGISRQASQERRPIQAAPLERRGSDPNGGLKSNDTDAVGA
jgi:hypothetical protein